MEHISSKGKEEIINRQKIETSTHEKMVKPIFSKGIDMIGSKYKIYFKQNCFDHSIISRVRETEPLNSDHIISSISTIFTGDL